VDSTSASGADPKMGGHLDQKDLRNPSGRSLALEKPSTTPTSSSTRSFTRSSLDLPFTRSFSDLPSAAVKNASGLSIPGPTVLWPDGRKSDDGLVNGGSGNEGVDKSCMVSMVEGRPVEGDTLGGGEPSDRLGTKLPKGRPEDDPSNAGTFRDEALDSKLANRQGEAEQGSRGTSQPCSRYGRTWAMISELTAGEYQLTFSGRAFFRGEEFKAQVRNFSPAASRVGSKLGRLSIWCCMWEKGRNDPCDLEGIFCPSNRRDKRGHVERHVPRIAT
jgi:hypothetical protein